MYIETSGNNSGIQPMLMFVVSFERTDIVNPY